MDHSIQLKVFMMLLYSFCGIYGDFVQPKVQLDIAVIGAGPGGLFSAKHSLAHGHRVTIYEQSDEIGGVWVYTNETGKNKYGLDIHTAMYKGLR